MEQKPNGPKFPQLVNKRTIEGVTKLLDRAKKCQATAKNVLENKKRAYTKNQNGCKLNKYEKEKRIEETTPVNPTIVSDGSIVTKKIDLEHDTMYCHFSNTIYGSKFETSQIEKDVTLKDGKLHLKEIGNQCCFLSTMKHVNVLNDSKIGKCSDEKRSNNVQIGV